MSNRSSTTSLGGGSMRGIAGLSSVRNGHLHGAVDGEFNLQALKRKVLRQVDERMLTAVFKRFYGTPLCDRLLKTLLLYFTAMFQMEWVAKSMERSRKHLEGFSPPVVAARIQELSSEVAALRMEISPMYAEMLLKYAKYDKGQQDRQFFELLYAVLIDVLDEAFSRLGKRPDIEREIGAIFRSKHFNLYKRRNAPARSVDTLAVKELYELKHETDNRLLNARMLASLHEKPHTIGVQVASVTNSPLISQFLTSPIVARSVLKDPESRNKMQESMQRASMHASRAAPKPEGQQQGSLDSTAQKGADGQDLDGQGGRNSLLTGAGGVGVLSESAGLPMDDSFSFLLALKRAATNALDPPSTQQQPQGISRSLSQFPSMRSMDSGRA